MGRNSLVLGVGVTFAAAIMGWIIWAERPVPIAPPTTQPAAGSSEAGPMPILDEARVEELTSQVESDPNNVESRRALATVYFEAQRFEEAIPWYEEVLALTPNDVESSTRLGTSFFYGDLPERAVEQFDRSLEIEPDHAQTLLNIGIVRAFGLQDLEGATAAWNRVLEVAPDGPEALGAREGLALLQSAHESSGTSGEPASAGLP
jgi:tetratricopeptide (TPR) repeat protein